MKWLNFFKKKTVFPYNEPTFRFNMLELRKYDKIYLFNNSHIPKLSEDIESINLILSANKIPTGNTSSFKLIPTNPRDRSDTTFLCYHPLTPSGKFAKYPQSIRCTLLSNDSGYHEKLGNNEIRYIIYYLANGTIGKCEIASFTHTCSYVDKVKMKLDKGKLIISKHETIYF